MRTGLMVIWSLCMGITSAAQLYSTQAGKILVTGKYKGVNVAAVSNHVHLQVNYDRSEIYLRLVIPTLISQTKILLGGKRIDRKGTYMEATILTDIKPGVPAYYEELFGPVASFYRVKDEAAAIELANDSPFGLGGSVFTNDIERGKKVADQIDTGMVFINHPTWT